MIRNPPSLDLMDSILSFTINFDLLTKYVPRLIKNNRIKNAKNIGPKDSAVKEWTEEIIPLLVMNVPSITKINEPEARKKFQDFKIPFLS